jgi:hypothetical protein
MSHLLLRKLRSEVWKKFGSLLGKLADYERSVAAASCDSKYAFANTAESGSTVSKFLTALRYRPEIPSDLPACLEPREDRRFKLNRSNANVNAQADYIF